MAAQSLIPVFSGSINHESISLVDARILHEFLDVGKNFPAWIKGRISQYGFVEGQDYLLTFSKTGERKNVKVNHYHLTLDMAKELSMVERNAKGRQARRYFIDCEKKLHQVTVGTIGKPGHKCLSDLIEGKTSHLMGKAKVSAKSRLWAQVRKAYGVDVAADIPADQLDSARQFVGGYVLEGDYLPAEPQQVAMPLEVTAFSPKRMPSEFDRRHGRLAAEQLHDCGWNLDLLWAVKWLKEHEGQTVRLEPGIADQLALELDSVLYWYESYRNRLSSIYQEAKIAAPRSALIR